MALLRCGAVSSVQETVLWTNSSPTTNFSSQTITLSEDIDNFEYLKIKALGSTTNNLEINIYISVEDFKKGGNSGAVAGPALYGANSGGTARRALYYKTDTTILVDNAEGGASTFNNIAIPVEISGINGANIG